MSNTHLNKPIAYSSTTDILASLSLAQVSTSMSLKPNNLIALLVAAILLAIGIALAALHQREENRTPKPETDSSSLLRPVIEPIEKDLT